MSINDSHFLFLKIKGRAHKSKKGKHSKKAGAKKQAQLARHTIGRSIPPDHHNELGTAPYTYDDKANKQEDEIFNYNSFLNLSNCQSNLIHNLMLGLAAKFEKVHDVIVNKEAGIGLLSKCVRYKKYVKRNSQKQRDKFDKSRVFDCISTIKRMVTHFFANSSIKKLLVNVLNAYHSTALLIEKNGAVYTFTSFDPNNGRTMTMTHLFCKTFYTAKSKTRNIQCVSGHENNENDACFAISWNALFKCLMGQMCLKQYPAQFTYDFIAKKKK